MRLHLIATLVIAFLFLDCASGGKRASKCLADGTCPRAADASKPSAGGTKSDRKRSSGERKKRKVTKKSYSSVSVDSLNNHLSQPEPEDDAMSSRGFMYLQQNNAEAAIKTFYQLLTHDNIQDRLNGHYGVALASWSMGDYDSAIIHINSCIDINPSTLHYFLFRSRMNAFKGDIDSMMADVRAVAEMFQVDFETIFVFGTDFLKNSRPFAALTVFQYLETIKGTEVHSSAAYWSSRSQAEEGCARDREALDSLRRAMSLDATLPPSDISREGE